MSRIIAAGLITSGLMVGFLPLWIYYLKKMQLGQRIRQDGPESHRLKEGVPTMGGALFWPVLLVVTLGAGQLNSFVVGTILITGVFTLLGFQDDFFKIKKDRSLGLKARHKIFFMIILGGAVGFYLFQFQPGGTTLLLPWSAADIELGWLIIPLTVLVYLGTANAVNLTDGLDGLAAGVSAIILLGLTVLSLFYGNETGALLGISGAGICLGFLWYNCHPARVFMGDTGSLMLGSLIASLVVFQQLSFLLLILGGLLVLITLSVIIQVIYFRLTGGRRIFKMTPLHHHFELSGWAEPQVVVRFWLVAALFTLLGIWGGL